MMYVHVCDFCACMRVKLHGLAVCTMNVCVICVHVCDYCACV